MEVRAAAICCICKCSVDLDEDYCILNSHYAHRDCTTAYDSRDLGAIDFPERILETFEGEEA